MGIMSTECLELNRPQVTIRLANGLCLLFIKPGLAPWEYPSCRIQKGLIIASGSRELGEEGTGLGLPLVRYGNEAIFPGDASVSTERDGDQVGIRVSYNLNLILRRSLRSGRTIESPLFYRIDEFFSRLHRQHPLSRNILTLASYPIKLFYGMNNGFRKIESFGSVIVKYDVFVGDGVIHTSLDISGLKRDGCTEIIVANEQGANHFDLYRDSDGLFLRGKEIGSWNETLADTAFLVGSRDGISFSIDKIGGARLFRGRELALNRLAWAGLNYVLPGHTANFAYDIKVGTP